MKPLNRQHFLKGLGTTIALPHLTSLHGESNDQTNNKMVFLSFGYGVTQETWFPSTSKQGKNYQLPPGLAPLARHKADISIIQGTQHQYTIDGHFGSTFYLTGANRYAIQGKNFHNTISADQIAARKWGDGNRYSSLQFDCVNAKNSGHGPGLSLAWNQKGKPMPGLTDPFKVYHKLFGNDTMTLSEKKMLIKDKKSSLDAVLIDAKKLHRKINSEDKDKLNEYFDSVREIELQLEKENAWIEKPKPKPPLKEPSPGLQGYQEIKLMYDLIVAALQTNSTRVITYRQPVDTLLKSLDVTITPHNMSHYGTGSRLVASKLRDEKQSELIAYFLDKLKNTKSTENQSLLDQTTLSYGSNIRHSHTLKNCPIILAGNKKKIKLGENHVLPEGTPLCNLWLTLLNANGLNQQSFGDSTGLIESILV